jgi:hypothetical protein
LFIDGVIFGLIKNLNYRLTIHEKSKNPFDPLNIGTNDLGKLQINEYGAAYINTNKSILNTKTTNLFSILNRIIAIRLDLNETIVACGKIVSFSTLNFPIKSETKGKK